MTLSNYDRGINYSCMCLDVSLYLLAHYDSSTLNKDCKAKENINVFAFVYDDHICMHAYDARHTLVRHITGG